MNSFQLGAAQPGSMQLGNGEGESLPPPVVVGSSVPIGAYYWWTEFPAICCAVIENG